MGGEPRLARAGQGGPYTERSSSDPRGKLRGGAAGGLGDTVPVPVAVDFGGAWIMGTDTGGVGRIRARCIFAGPATAARAVP
jgi:hypothetical protein